MRAYSIAMLDGVRIFKGNLTVSGDVKLQPVAVATAAIAEKKETHTHLFISVLLALLAHLLSHSNPTNDAKTQTQTPNRNQ